MARGTRKKWKDTQEIRATEERKVAKANKNISK